MSLTGLAVLCLAGIVSGFQSCPENCDMKNSAITPCDTKTRACFRGCIPGHYGNTCNMTCDIYCQGSTCQQRGGTCKCKPGYKFNRGSCVKNKGATCRSSNHCRDNMCLSAGRKECLKGCDPGWFGSACNQPCEDRKSGNCSDDCGIGFYGSKCDQKCSQHCVSGCDQLSGECVQCEAGRYGSICQLECSAGCAGPNKDCDRDGRCINGCVKGYYGETCTHDICNQVTGECTKECQSGYYGQDCIKTCRTCIDGLCSVSTGECMTGCKSGFYGSFCNLTCKECKDGDCDQDTGECRHKDEKGDKSSEVQSWVGGGVAVISIISIAAALFYMSRRLKRMQGVDYNVVKWRRRSPSAAENVRSAAAAPGLELEEEVSVVPPRVCPISPTRQTSYIEPQHSGESRNNFHIQPKQAAGVSNQQKEEPQKAPSYGLIHDVLRRSDEWSDSYTLPNYVEVNEELLDTLPQPTQGAEAYTTLVAKASFSVVADVHVTEGDISIPLIAESFGPNMTEDSSTDKDTQPYVENYNHLYTDGNSQIGQAIPSSYDQFNDEPKSILHPISTAKSTSYIEPRHCGLTVPSQQDISTTGLSDKQEEEPQDPVAPSSDRLPEDVVMTTLIQTPQSAEAPVLNSHSSSPTADVHGTGADISIAECFGLTETENSTPEKVSNY